MIKCKTVFLLLFAIEPLLPFLLLKKLTHDYLYAIDYRKEKHFYMHYIFTKKCKKNRRDMRTLACGTFSCRAFKSKRANEN